MAIKNPENRGSYSEEYDAPAIQELADMAERYVRNTVLHESVHGKQVPDGTYSDFSCIFWEILVEYGRRLVRE